MKRHMHFVAATKILHFFSALLLSFTILFTGIPSAFAAEAAVIPDGYTTTPSFPAAIESGISVMPIVDTGTNAQATKSATVSNGAAGGHQSFWFYYNPMGEHSAKYIQFEVSNPANVALELFDTNFWFEAGGYKSNLLKGSSGIRFYDLDKSVWSDLAVDDGGATFYPQEGACIRVPAKSHGIVRIPLSCIGTDRPDHDSYVFEQEKANCFGIFFHTPNCDKSYTIDFSGFAFVAGTPTADLSDLLLNDFEGAVPVSINPFTKNVTPTANGGVGDSAAMRIALQYVPDADWQPKAQFGVIGGNNAQTAKCGARKFFTFFAKSNAAATAQLTIYSVDRTKASMTYAIDLAPGEATYSINIGSSWYDPLRFPILTVDGNAFSASVKTQLTAVTDLEILIDDVRMTAESKTTVSSVAATSVLSASVPDGYTETPGYEAALQPGFSAMTLIDTATGAASVQSGTVSNGAAGGHRYFWFYYSPTGESNANYLQFEVVNPGNVPLELFDTNFWGSGSYKSNLLKGSSGIRFYDLDKSVWSDLAVDDGGATFYPQEGACIRVPAKSHGIVRIPLSCIGTADAAADAAEFANETANCFGIFYHLPDCDQAYTVSYSNFAFIAGTEIEEEPDLADILLNDFNGEIPVSINPFAGNVTHTANDGADDSAAMRISLQYTPGADWQPSGQFGIIGGQNALTPAYGQRQFITFRADATAPATVQVTVSAADVTKPSETYSVDVVPGVGNYSVAISDCGFGTLRFPVLTVDAAAFSDEVKAKLTAVTDISVTIDDVRMTAEAQKTESGDANNDGAINIKDLISLKKQIAAGGYNTYADINRDAVLTAEDLVMIRKLLLGLPLYDGEAVVHYIDATLPASYIAGDCILIQADGKNILIDGGEDNAAITDSILAYLDNLGIQKLDYVFLSHAHSDHAGGLSKIIGKYDLGYAATRAPDFSLLASVEVGWKTEYYYNQFVSAAAAKGVTVEQITDEAKQIRISDNAMMTIYGASIIDQQTKDEDYNFLSLTFKFTYKNKSFYFGGDAGDPTDAVMLGNVGQCDVVKLSHHGSAGPYSSVALLNELQPKYALFTTFIQNAHDYNDYYYQTVQRVAAVGGKSYSSAANGTMVAITDGNEILSFSGTSTLNP